MAIQTAVALSASFAARKAMREPEESLPALLALRESLKS
jgi:hypothetical protein